MPDKKIWIRIKENINLFIYPGRAKALTILRFLRLFVSSFMVGSLIHYYGFPQEQDAINTYIIIIRSSFIFFISSYLIRLFFEFEVVKFIRETWLEGLFMLFLFFDLVSFLFIKEPVFKILFEELATENALEMFGAFTQICLLLIVLLEFGKASQKLTYLKVNPSLLFIISFIFLILGGTALLTMPEMTADKQGMSFINALFTATSASCVTGLTVVDMGTYFSEKGIVLIMILVQLGGLNIISFASFFAAFVKKGIGLRHHAIIKDFMSYDSLSSTHSLLKRVVFMTLIIELLGAILIYFTWNANVIFENTGQKIFFSVFHSISAFNNAGFSTFTDGLFNPMVRDSYYAHTIMAILVFLGGIGIPVLNDVLNIDNLRQRMLYPWKRLQLTSRIAIYTSVLLILVGALIFYFVETQSSYQQEDGGVGTLSFFGQVVTSFFQSVVVRTAGFNTTNFAILSTPTLLIFLLLMFIGASPGGTGGGIKTTTFAAIFLSAIATIRGKKHVEVFKQTIPNDLLYKAFSIFLFSLSVVFLGTLILSFTEPNLPLLHLAFEEVSAFATVGSSTGITPNISIAGKYVLIASMFIGRVGVFTLALALSKKTISTNYKYLDGYVMIG
ncbi:MAG: hypothetical protein LC101_05640 [Flavobacteriales bacterium]|nr:hypothetical protein [Flavobacteriales bacterium]